MRRGAGRGAKVLGGIAGLMGVDRVYGRTAAEWAAVRLDLGKSRFEDSEE